MMVPMAASVAVIADHTADADVVAKLGFAEAVTVVSGEPKVVVGSERVDRWYRVRTAGGKSGWVHRSQLQATMTQAGVKKSFRDTLLDDYLRRRVEAGAAWGQFSREPMLKAVGAFRLSDTLALEGTLGQVQGLYSGTDFWHANLLVEPWSDRRLSPYVGIGFGQFRNIPNGSLVAAQTTNAKLSNGVVGLRWHLSERFMVRVEYTLHTAYVAHTRSAEYRAATAGLSFFF